MSIGNHPLVVRFLKGVFNLRPPVPRYKEVWDVSIVLRFLKTLSPVSSLSLKNLNLKLVMLLSLVTAQRGQTLHLLDVNLMSTYDSSIVIQLSGINLDVYKAHSTRAASVSAAHRAQVPVQEILRKAGWSSAQTFAIYYDKNLDTSESSASQFQEAILTL